ncbi:hypothetical protein WDZ17_07990 [Pseudokineococcus basanitobsidens]|uniref:Uncharacterized protein n=1 Tax=Pseudokineococcus basanitobsidens TaxID=1926649 RepID=A0ABU8RJH8_9ACTN
MTSQDPTPAEDRDAATPGGADDSTSGSDHVMDMLGEHVPLSLLMDLTSPAGPDSETISADEGLPEDSWWDEGGESADGSQEQPAQDS